MAAVTTEVNVANLALQRIGAKTITAFDAGDRNADAVNLAYYDVRDEVMRTFPWACLIGRTALATSAATNSGFAYKHTLAAAVLRVLDINADESIKFRVEGLTLYTNVQTGYFRHVSISDTVSTWDSLLISCIECRLASKVAYKITQNLELAQVMFQEYIMMLGIAIKLAAIEQHEDNLKILSMLQNMSPEALLRKDFVSE